MLRVDRLVAAFERQVVEGEPERRLAADGLAARDDFRHRALHQRARLRDRLAVDDEVVRQVAGDTLADLGGLGRDLGRQLHRDRRARRNRVVLRTGRHRRGRRLRLRGAAAPEPASGPASAHSPSRAPPRGPRAPFPFPSAPVPPRDGPALPLRACDLGSLVRSRLCGGIARQPAALPPASCRRRQARARRARSGTNKWDFLKDIVMFSVCSP